MDLQAGLSGAAQQEPASVILNVLCIFVIYFILFLKQIRIQ